MFYARGYKDGRRDSLVESERMLAILREELCDVRRDRDTQMARADAACDILLGHLGARAISLAGKQEEVDRADRHVKAVTTLASLPDPTEDLPYGDPRGLYPDKASAALFPNDEDVATDEG